MTKSKSAHKAKSANAAKKSRQDTKGGEAISTQRANSKQADVVTVTEDGFEYGGASYA